MQSVASPDSRIPQFGKNRIFRHFPIFGISDTIASTISAGAGNFSEVILPQCFTFTTMTQDRTIAFKVVIHRIPGLCNQSGLTPRARV
jgi:hypothetical protein